MIGFYEDYFKRRYQAFIKEQKNVGCPTHFHGEAELSFVLNGTHTAAINGKEYVLTAGDAYFLNPFDIHKYESVDGGEHILLTVRPNEYLMSIGGKNLCLPNFLGDKEYNKKLLEILRFALSDADNSGVLNEYERRGYASLIVGAIIRRYGETVSVKKGELNEILDYLNENYKSDFSRDEVAAKFGYSPNYFSKLFKKYFNMGFTEYVLNLKYQKTLIECGQNGAKKRADIILENFSNPQTFYRLNKKYNKDYQKIKNYHD